MRGCLRLGTVLAAVLITAAMPSAARATTFVGGVINADTSWTVAGSPYIVTSKVQIASNKTLTIQPGARVERGANYTDDLFLVAGKLSVAGTEQAPVTIDGGNGNGYGNLICAAATSNVPATGGGEVVIDHAVLQHAGHIFWGSCGTDYGGSLVLTHSLVRDTSGWSYVWYPIRDSYVEHNTFVNASGFSLGNNDTFTYVRNNRFVSRYPAGSNTFWVRSWAGYNNHPAEVHDNVFENVGQRAVELQFASGQMDATCNYWGTTDESLIQSMIWDGNDDVLLATIAYDPWLSEEPAETAQLPQTLVVSASGLGTVTSELLQLISCPTTCEASYAYGTLVTLAASPASGYTFSGWSGGGCSGTGDCVATMDQARSVTATFTEITYSLDLSKDGAGEGSVTSSPLGISCGATCQADFVHDTVVTLSASASTGSLFAGWSGEGCTGTGSCHVTMDQARSVSATFLVIYPLQIAKTGTGAGTITSSPAGIGCGATCSKAFLADTEVTLTATASMGSTFDGWSGDCAGADNPCVVTLDQARSVTATFTEITYLLDVSRDGVGSGTVSSTPAGISCGTTCQASYTHDTVVTLTASADAGSLSTGWAGEGCTGTGMCQVTMTQARSVTATFQPANELQIDTAGTGTGKVNSSPSGINCGSTCSKAFIVDTEVTLMAAPSAGSSFGSWSGDCTGTESICVVTLDQARSVTANFNLIPRYRPDGLIGLSKSTDAMLGDGRYNTTGFKQTKAARLAHGASETFWVRMRNDGNVADSLNVEAPGSTKAFRVRYFVGDTNVTADVGAGGLELADIQPGGSRVLKVTIGVSSRARPGASRTILITGTSVGSGTRVDAVGAKVTVD
jgi:Divergent InlB B-repeat domain